MITFRSELDPEDVREAGRTTHAALALKSLGIGRCVHNHRVADPRGSERTYDEYVMRWDALPDGRFYVASPPAAGDHPA